MSLNSLGARLPSPGRPDQAVFAAEDALSMYRQLAGTNPAAYGPDLARALSVITQIRVTSRSELPEALAAVRESVAIYRQLAANTCGIWR
jgi:hypothetical protein